MSAACRSCEAVTDGVPVLLRQTVMMLVDVIKKLAIGACVACLMPALSLPTHARPQGSGTGTQQCRWTAFQRCLLNEAGGTPLPGCNVQTAERMQCNREAWLKKHKGR